jgi:integrase
MMKQKNIVERTTANGEKRYRVRVRLKGVYVSKTFRSKAHAQQWLQNQSRTIGASAELGILDDSDYSTKTVKDAVESFLTFKLPTLTSGENNRSLLDEIVRTLGTKKLNDVDHDDVFLAVREYRSGGKRGRSESSANKFINLISSVFTEARRKKWTKNKPTEFVKRYDEERFQRTRSLSKEEEERLIKEAEKNIYPNSVVSIWLALLTGYRKDWIRHMKWDYINFDRRMIQLPLGKINPHGKTGKNTAKGLPIVEKLYQELKKHRALLRAAGVNSPYLFPQESNANKAWNIIAAYKSAVKRAGIENLTFHDLRHSAATNLVMKGIHQRIIGEMLGHKDARSTQRYTHVPTEHMRNELEKAFFYSNDGGEDETV